MHPELGGSPRHSLITSKRRVLAAQAFAIGLAAGLVAVGFRLSLEWIEAARSTLIAFARAQGGAYFALPPLTFAVFTVAVVLLTARYAPEAGGSGIPHLKGYLLGENAFPSGRILAAKFLGGVAGIGSGLALGREGPTVQMGAAVGKILGDLVSRTRVDRRILVSAGAGAGLAAAFNAPFAGVFFVLEELHSTFHPAVLVTAFVASVTANIVCRLLMGTLPVFHIRLSAYPELGVFPYFLLLGGVLGVLGLLFNKSLLWSSDCVSRLGRCRKAFLALLVGLVCGGVGLLAPESLGTGTELITSALSSRMIYSELAVYFLLRFVLTMASYSTGAPGGIFAPLLLLGVLAGSFFGDLVSDFTRNSAVSFSAWAVLGMAGFFSAVVRAPITGTILILEMTGAYDLLLPLMVVSLISYSIPEFFEDEPVYEALLQRDLRRRTEARLEPSSAAEEQAG